MIRHIQSPGIVRTVYSSISKDIQAYSGTLMYIQPHSQVHNLGGERSLPSTFFKIEKSDLILDKKGPSHVHLWVKFSIQSLVLRLFRRKNSKMFPCGAFFSCDFDEMFIEVPQFHETSPILKNLWLHASIPALFFLQNASS